MEDSMKEKLLQKILDLFTQMPDKEDGEGMGHEMGEMVGGEDEGEAPKAAKLEMLAIGKPEDMKDKKEMC